MEYYSVIKRNEFELIIVRWMILEPVIQSAVNQKEKIKYHILTYIYIYIYMKFRKTVLMKLFAGQE